MKKACLLLLLASIAARAVFGQALTTIPATRMYPIAGSSCTLMTVSVGAASVPAWSCAVGSKLAFSLPVSNTAQVLPMINVVTRPSAVSATAKQYCVILTPHMYADGKIYDSTGSDIRNDTWMTGTVFGVDMVAADDVSVPTSGTIPLYYSSYNSNAFDVFMKDISGASVTSSYIGEQLTMAIGIYGCSGYCSATPIKPSCCSGTCTNYDNNVLILGVNYLDF